jgi:hypothetical protein
MLQPTGDRCQLTLVDSSSSSAQAALTLSVGQSSKNNNISSSDSDSDVDRQQHRATMQRTAAENMAATAKHVVAASPLAAAADAAALEPIAADACDAVPDLMQWLHAVDGDVILSDEAPTAAAVSSKHTHTRSKTRTQGAAATLASTCVMDLPGDSSTFEAGTAAAARKKRGYTAAASSSGGENPGAETADNTRSVRTKTLPAKLRGA